MRSAGGHAFERTVGGRGSGTLRFLIGGASKALLVGAISCVVLWLVWIYDTGLRDPRYFDGWIFAVGMMMQLFFHISIKTAWLAPKSILRWKKVHIFIGYLLIAAFLSHSNFSLPHSGFGWALWIGFVLVTLSGLFGIYLSWSLKTKHNLDESIGYDRIPARRAELARDVRAAASDRGSAAIAATLPAPSFDAWINDLYATHLKDFFDGHRNAGAHLVGSQRALKKLTDEIENLARYVDAQGQEKLTVIKTLVIEKDRLDFARVHLGLTRAWLLVHVPVTYSLIVLTVLHIIVVYSFSAGNW